MTSPGEANVVPIALTLEGRTGYTIWAAPWVEDGDEWQAFLGAGSKVFVFEDLDDLATYLGVAGENDLSDHPAWSMLQTLPADQLAPEDGYDFDLDEVPDLTEQDADDEVVMRVGDALDMVQRLAECCDDGPLLHLLESPAFAALLDEEPDLEDVADGDGAVEDLDVDDEDDGDGEAAADASSHDGDEDGEDGDEDDPWAEIGEAVRTSWPVLISRLQGCLEWYAAGEVPETGAADDGDDDASGVTSGSVEVATAAGRGGAAGGGGEDDEKAARFWSEAGISPVLIIGPSGAGHTLRCYLDDEARFLGSDQGIDVFRSTEGLAAYCRETEEHDLAELDTWPQVRGADDLPVIPSHEDVYDLSAAEAQLHAGPSGADPVVLRRAIEFLADVAEYCDLDGLNESLTEDSPLGQAVGAVLRSATGSILGGVAWNGGEAAELWREAVAEAESCLRWHD